MITKRIKYTFGVDATEIFDTRWTLKDYVADEIEYHFGDFVTRLNDPLLNSGLTKIPTLEEVNDFITIHEDTLKVEHLSDDGWLWYNIEVTVEIEKLLKYK